jgi:hypothetical protein
MFNSFVHSIEGRFNMAIIIKPPVSGGGGAVDSVNGATGVVGR